MSKVRMVNTRFWSDNFIREHLNPLDRYLFLYFLTNEKTNICGVYELPLSTISSETGLEKEMISKMFTRLQGRIDYFDGWVIIRNFVRYQNTDSDKIKIGINNALSEIPLRIREYLDKEIPYTYPMDMIGIRPRESESKLESESESKLELETPSQIARDFFSKGKSFELIFEEFAKKSNREHLESEINNFILYWTEPNKSGTKVKWQQEPTFEIKRRLLKWLDTSRSFSSKKETKIL